VGARSHPAPAFAGPAPAPDEEAFPADAVEVGQVLGAWGVKGGLKVKPFSSDPQALFSSRRWHLQPADLVAGPRPQGAAPVPRLLRITQAREQGELIVATCRELSDRDAAQALSGARIYVSRNSFPTPDEDEFYWVDLIGLAVRNRTGELLGTVTHLIETGPHCVLCVRATQEQAAEVLIPFVAAYVDRVDLSGRTIHVDWDASF